MEVTAESVASVCADADEIGGLAFTDEPEDLRFFLARFRPLPVPAKSTAEVSQRPLAEPLLIASGG
jgi:hypothetical protein